MTKEPLTEHYKFVQNNKCEFFPCHQIADDKKFNCLFCFCPLYMLKDKCGGNFKYTNGVKDCSDCIIPHTENAYDYIMSKMSEVVRIGSLKQDS